MQIHQLPHSFSSDTKSLLGVGPQCAADGLCFVCCCSAFAHAPPQKRKNSKPATHYHKHCTAQAHADGRYAGMNIEEMRKEVSERKRKAKPGWAGRVRGGQISSPKICNSQRMGSSPVGPCALAPPRAPRSQVSLSSSAEFVE